MNNALADLRVVELSRTAAAAFAGRLCATAGAEVVLVEPPAGHPLRRDGPFLHDEANVETSAAHLHINAGKRSVTIDLETNAGALLGLLEHVDVFLTDLYAHVLDSLGLSWTALHERWPSLVMTRVTPFGDNGPFARYEGTNLTGLASGGQLKITGDPDKPPLSNFGAQAEYQAGLSAFAGTVANVLLRDATGEGDYLDLSMQDVVATNLEHRSPALNLGLEANRVGLTVSATYGVYGCADGWVYITAFAPALWDRLKSIVGIAELDDERFSTQAMRLECNDELQALLASWAITKPSAELHELALRGYPLTVMTTPASLLESEQWRSRRVAQRVSHPIAGEFSLIGAPWFDEADPTPGPSPKRGGETRRLTMAESIAMRSYTAPLLGEANAGLLGARSEALRKKSTLRDERQLALLREVSEFLGAANVSFWLRGGWALDFLLGEVTRDHGDIDLVAWKHDEPKIRRAFARHGYSMTPQSASLDFEKDRVEVNVMFLEKGEGVVYTAGFRDEPRWTNDVLNDPPRSLRGLSCRTISARGLLEEKEKTPVWLGRPVRPIDVEAIKVLERLISAKARA